MYNKWKIENKKLVFKCGCSFDIIEERPGHFPLIEPKDPYKDWNYYCDATLMLLSNGESLGVFQLESHLGQTWCKVLKPETDEHMAALTAIIRPSCLETKDDRGLSTSRKYCMYKNGEEQPTPEVEALRDVLQDNYYQMLYQEDIMRVATEIAGFTGPEANTLMKGVGKKLQDVIASLKKAFIEGCKKVGKVTEEEAAKIWENIERAGRYGFNLCLNPNTLVEKTDGSMTTIKDCEIGEEILSSYGKTKVVNKYNNGKKPVIKVRLESGKVIECTVDHKFMCEDNIVRPLYEIIEKKLKIITKDD